MIFAEKWFGKKIGRGEFLASPEVVGDLAAHSKVNKYITFMRYPLVSYQNFPRLKHVGTAINLPDRIIIMNPDDAAYIQGDGDDHGTILYDLESTFHPEDDEAPIIARDVDDLGYDFGRLFFYFKGMVAQQSIGTTFNRMLQCLAAFKDAKKNPMPIYTTFGAALDIFAQGIKKNLKTPSLWLLKKLRDKFLGYIPSRLKESAIRKLGKWSKMAEIYLAERKRPLLAKLVRDVWGVKIPASLEVRPILIHRKLEYATPALRERIERFVAATPEEMSTRSPVTWVKELVAGLESVTGSFTDLRLEIMEGKTENLKDFYTFLDCYAYAAYTIAQEHGKVPHHVGRLETMNGLWILASQMTTEMTPSEKDIVVKTDYNKSKPKPAPRKSTVAKATNKVNIVEYNGKSYLHYKTNSKGFAQLVGVNGVHFSGTPRPDKLKVIKTYTTKNFNGHDYVKTQVGIFSCTSGNRIRAKEINAIFDK